MNNPRLLLLVGFLLSFLSASSQNENKMWYFSNQAGLDFNTNPPTILLNSMMNTWEGCASIAGSNGNLLFYTDGSTVYDQSHAAMANGTGLLGNSSTSQSAIIVKKPGSSSLYYVFTQAPSGGALHYSEIDMTLAAGMGSVTIKNVPLATNMTEHLTSVKHCNGSDVWVISHEHNSTTFRAYLVTSAGVNSTSINSTSGSAFGSFFIGCMKASPNGRKLAFAVAGSVLIEIFDFDPSSGSVSNPLSLGGNIPYPYGVEFSPDGTKFYAKGHYQLGQWDLTAGSTALIAASLNTFVTVNGIGSVQLAPDGKIYVARLNQTDLGVVNNPNIAGAGCNYVDVGQSISPKISAAGLPNFISSGFKVPYPPFTFTTSCNTASFSLVNQTYYPGVNFSVTSVQWDFGDPASASSNTSTSNNPIHLFTSPGTYTTHLIVYYSCGTDTITQMVTIAAVSPTLSIAGSFTICQNDKRTYTVSGASTYSWNNGITTPTISFGPSSITTTLQVTGTGTNNCSSKKTFTITVNKCTSISEETYQPDLKFYPNPASDLLFVENEERAEIILLNLQGMILLRQVYAPGHHELDLKPFENGIYQLKMITDKGISHRNVVKLTE